MRLKVWGLAAAGLAAITAGVALLLLQDAIARAILMPRTPFQVTAPPPAPDYDDPTRSAWLLWPAPKPDGVADIFYVHSTTYYSRRGWNGSTADAGIDIELKRLAAPNEAGPFVDVGRLYGPRYRQATLFAQFTHKFDGVAARRLA
ncbi:MAG: DUF3089 domain-containing protein, partial [Parvularculaceae bacterium]|nr:DUF3089 domain-containing protein [Parvularculaceae bacterium]